MRRVSNKIMSSHKTGHKMGFMVEERIRTGTMANGIESIHNWQHTVSNFSSLFGTKLRRFHYKVDKHVSYTYSNKIQFNNFTCVKVGTFLTVWALVEFKAANLVLVQYVDAQIFRGYLPMVGRWSTNTNTSPGRPFRVQPHIWALTGSESIVCIMYIV